MIPFSRTRLKAIPVLLAATTAGTTVMTKTAFADEKSFEVYGFAQSDYIQDFKRVNPSWEDTLRPSKIPTTSGTYGSDGQASVSIKQSRFGVQGNLPVEGTDLYTKFEFDLFGVGVDEGQTTIRPRHAYGQWGNWLAGQTNSLFMDGDVFPNVIDYWGPAGMAFFRTPQIRWTSSGQTGYTYSVAIEKPGADVDPGQVREIDPSLGSNIKADDKLPDLTAQIRANPEWGHVQMGGILRRLGYETIGTAGNAPSGHDIGWGLDFTGTFKVAAMDKFYLSGLFGEGIASYMNDGGTDIAPDGTGGSPTGKAVPLFGLMFYYDHYWTEQLSTTFGYSRTQVDNTSLQAANAFKRGEYASANLLFAPNKRILIGGEFLWGRRADLNGAKGEDTRAQLTFKYSFSSKDYSGRP